MRLIEFTYQHGEAIRTIVLCCVNVLTGYEAWPSATTESAWIIDDTITTIVHPILSSRVVGTVTKVVLA